MLHIKINIPITCNLNDTLTNWEIIYILDYYDVLH